jgi:pyruvate dehydrogenase E2 component (dihydrolipoamide acetyltransferase)
MVTELRMPKLGQVMEEATIVQWRVKVGDTIQKGQEILDVETDKAVLGVESTVSGLVVAILAKAGEQLPVGATLARIEQDN